jgi:hypothetical protein
MGWARSRVQLPTMPMGNGVAVRTQQREVFICVAASLRDRDDVMHVEQGSIGHTDPASLTLTPRLDQ